MAIIQFTNKILPYGFKLTKDFLESPFCYNSIKVVKESLAGRKPIIVTQTDIDKRNTCKYNPVFLDEELEEQLALDKVVENIRKGNSFKIPQVDGIWMKNTRRDKAILSFSQTAPIIVGYCSNINYSYIFISTMLKKDITKENFEHINKLLPSGHPQVTFEIISSTCFKYPEGTLVDQIKDIVTDLGCKFIKPSSVANVNTNPDLFGHSEKVPGFPELGLANNLVVIM